MPNILGGVFRTLRNEVAREVRNEVRRDVRNAVHTGVAEIGHDLLFRYNGSSPAAALKALRKDLDGTPGVLDARVAADPRASRRKLLLVSVEDEATRAKIIDFLRNKAPNTNAMVVVS